MDTRCHKNQFCHHFEKCIKGITSVVSLALIVSFLLMLKHPSEKLNVIICLIFFFIFAFLCIPALAKKIADSYFISEAVVKVNITSSAPRDLRKILLEEIRHIDELLETHTKIIIAAAVAVWGGILITQDYNIKGLILLIGLFLLVEMILMILRLGKLFVDKNARIKSLEDNYFPSERVSRSIFCHNDTTETDLKLLWTGYHHILVLVVGLAGVNLIALLVWLLGNYEEGIKTLLFN
jgi:hypothetical protein